MIAPLELNLNPETKPQMFGVTVERAVAICDRLCEISAKAAFYYVDQYSIEGTGESKGKSRLHEGKVLGEMLAVAETTGEWCFILFTALNYFEEITSNLPRAMLFRKTMDAIISQDKNKTNDAIES